ncbi:archaeal proteasome endopeptidase complex subunit beta [Candidatus Micrarchaeota archaeon]|nr:archaeal proteasome endopeptidase complex subunit beta [Candidatus Micrarchaeota archaeon]
MAELADEHKNFKGTTTVGIVYRDGVILAADKRATMGYFIASKDVEKIVFISDKIAITTAGGVGDAQALARMLRAELELYKYGNAQPLSVKGTATLLANILQGSRYYPYLVQIIVGGFDDAPRIFDIDLLGGLLEERYTSTGSGSVVAYGILDEGFKDSLSQDEAVKLAVRAVRGAIKRDSATGEGVDVVVITRDAVKKLRQSDAAAGAS